MNPEYKEDMFEYDTVIWDEDNVNPYLTITPSLAINIPPELYNIYQEVSDLYGDIYSISNIIEQDSNAVIIANQDNYNLFEKFDIVRKIYNNILKNINLVDKEILLQAANTFFKVNNEFLDFINKHMRGKVYIRGLRY